MSDLRGWQLLHSKLPASAIRPLATAVYGVAGLSDVNEAYLIRRLFKSDLTWHWRVVKQEYLGFEDRPVRDKDYTQRYYLSAVHGELTIEAQVFHGSGASDNRKLDAAFKGANTVAFKNACKWAGLTAELFLDGKAIDDMHQGRVTKDPDMAPATVERLLNDALETFGDPLERTGPDERLGDRMAASAPAMTPVQSSQEVPADASGSVAHEEPVSSPVLPAEDEVAELFALARTLKTPATLLTVQNEVAAHGIKGVRRRLILAHARDCGKSPCEHVAVLAGLK